jgi:hypothetical protein
VYMYILIIAAAEWFLRTARASASADNGNWGAVKTDMTEDINHCGSERLIRPGKGTKRRHKQYVNRHSKSLWEVKTLKISVYNPESKCSKY